MRPLSPTPAHSVRFPSSTSARSDARWRSTLSPQCVFVFMFLQPCFPLRFPTRSVHLSEVDGEVAGKLAALQAQEEVSAVALQALMPVSL
jgi:hypothetical protein